ncbi:right-handed parallel beta-helix repeat-containing protein, partial [bacterium]|nr:right-handed parallel beta-helix repeat-containing protein [bacterium]
MKPLCTILIVLALTQASLAQLSGSLSGTLGPGEFHVVDTIYVEAERGLTLFPGTTFNFDGPYPFWIYGTFTAEGTERDSIIFTTDTVANPDRWRGLRFSDSYCSATLSYCRIENSLATSDELYGPKKYGGGILCTGVSSLTFENCVISGNRAASRGGGIYCYSCSPTFTNCIISDNESDTWCGGGVYCASANATFTNCIIRENRAGDDGGGVELYDYSIVTFTDCDISDNISGGWGGGINSAGSRFTISNSTMCNNTAGRGGGMAVYETWATITDCDISNNTARAYGGGVH